MTNSSNIKVDDKEVIKALSNLSFKKMNSAYKKAMKKSLEPIQKQAKANLRTSGIKNVSKKYVSKKNGKTYPSMISGIKESVYIAQNDEDSYGKVHIMGEFRLKWFEKGTVLRHTKNGKSTGMITPKWYFKAAYNEKGKEASDSLEDNIRESIKKAYEKK